MEIDPEAIARIRARARQDREIVDQYNADLLRTQGIEPTEELLQEMCGQNIAAAMRAHAKQLRESDLAD